MSGATGACGRCAPRLGVCEWTMTVTALHRYPIKSMLGEECERVVVAEAGVLGDRGYALLDVETGTVASAKVPRRWGQLLGFAAAYVEEPRAAEPLPPVAITFPGGQVHRSDDPDVDARLSGALEREVRLVTAPPEGATYEELWPDIDGLAPQKLIADTHVRDEDAGPDDGRGVSGFGVSPFGAPGTFFDLCTLHVLTTATLDALAAQAPDSVFDALRYRPDVVLDTGERGFVENGWPETEARVGDVGLRFTFATMRCVMTTLAQGDLAEDRDTLRTVARHNRILIPQLGGRWACAGVYADVLAPGEVALGDPFVRSRPSGPGGGWS